MPFDGTTVNPVIERLVQARQYLEEHGWCKRCMVDLEGRVCIRGAISLGQYQWWVGALTDELVKKTDYQLALGLPDLYHWDVGAWNNAPERTVKDIYKLIDDTIAIMIKEHVDAV